jgi:hypothetical protein
MAIAFPAGIWPTRIMFDLELASRTGGASISGSEQVIASGAGRWRATASFSVRTEAQVLNWRGFRASLDGMAGAFDVSPFDFYRPYDINGRKVSGVDHASFAPETMFYDGSAFGQSDQTYATLAASVSAGVTRLTVTANASWVSPRPGQYFGIGDRLYIVTRAWRSTVTDPWTVDFRPRLRASAIAGTRVIIDRPTCKMRLASDGSGALDLVFGRFASTSLEFVEVV